MIPVAHLNHPLSWRALKKLSTISSLLEVSSIFILFETELIYLRRCDHLSQEVPLPVSQRAVSQQQIPT
jgi:hypothetical protein